MRDIKNIKRQLMILCLVIPAKGFSLLSSPGNQEDSRGSNKSDNKSDNKSENQSANMKTDAGFYMKIIQQKDRENSLKNGVCPKEIYLGGKGESYATGIQRTANFRPYVKSAPKKTVLIGSSEKNTLQYQAPLKELYKECSGFALSNAKLGQSAFIGERYEYTFKDGFLFFSVHAGPSLLIEHLGIYKMQPVFLLAEKL